MARLFLWGFPRSGKTCLLTAITWKLPEDLVRIYDTATMQYFHTVWHKEVKGEKSQEVPPQKINVEYVFSKIPPANENLVYDGLDFPGSYCAAMAANYMEYVYTSNLGIFLIDLTRNDVDDQLFHMAKILEVVVTRSVLKGVIICLSKADMVEASKIREIKGLIEPLLVWLSARVPYTIVTTAVKPGGETTGIDELIKSIAEMLK